MKDNGLRDFITSTWVGVMTSIHEMRSHKLRSFLSLLGVMLGVGALVAMLTIVGGVDDFMKREMGRYAGRVGLSRSRNKPDDMKEKLEWSRSPGLRFSDFNFLEGLQEVGKVFKLVNSHERIKKGLGARLRGVNKGVFKDETSIVMKNGREFTDEEYSQGLPVCILSWKIDEELGKNVKNSKGKDRFIPLHGKKYKVVGVFEMKTKGHRKRWYRHMIMIPILTLQKYKVGFESDPRWSSFEIKNLDDIDNEVNVIGEKLARHHRSVEDFTIHIFEFLAEFMKLINNVKVLFGLIAAASLSVGGLGIMNVMLSSLSERIKEIGVRKALGASNKQIFIQFIAETVTLSFIGGTMGMAIGSLPMWFSEAIYKAGGELIRPQLSSVHLFLVFLVISTVGVIFGLYPAVKASKMNPVDALRYE